MNRKCKNKEESLRLKMGRWSENKDRKINKKEVTNRRERKEETEKKWKRT